MPTIARKCPICKGDPYKNLGQHFTLKHGISYAQYKANGNRLKPKGASAPAKPVATRTKTGAARRKPAAAQPVATWKPAPFIVLEGPDGELYLAERMSH